MNQRSVFIPSRASFVLSLAFIVVIMLLQRASGEQMFTVNGERVSASRYQASVLVNNAVELMKQNRANDAAGQLERALKLDPELPEARGILGIVLARIGRTDDAVDELRMAISQKRSLFNARLNLATLYQSTGRFGDAIATYDAMIKDFPDSDKIGAVAERASLLRKEMAAEAAANPHEKPDSFSASGGIQDSPAPGFAALAALYEYTIGHDRKRWPRSQMPLKVFIYPGDGVEGYSAEMDKILQESFAEWQDKSQGRIAFVYVKVPSRADITVRWIDDQNTMQSAAEGGEAEVASLLGAIIGVRIRLSLYDPGSAFPLTDNLIRTLCLHEIGHSLGLIGHSASAKDVMFCTSPIVDREQHLSARDVNTMRDLYSRDVDMLSQLLAELERKTGGNAIPVMRFGIFGFTLICAALLGVEAIRAASGKKKKKRQDTGLPKPGISGISADKRKNEDH